ncbi:DNA-processing protein DprA [Curtobacterium sp. MCBD17_040]|uniref:DNA-processing protein DprA n=1 Tax=Curtobacterium sp. MCBD17_040 TaxID=2175674 RepID=UPI000DAAD0FE|nr:DNA-processing protein DprA [Curtobacterium sp. MCBD17_040]WIB62443.1 DNA-processing protein DprA [Curtobacterium sp. MCBD17_040]
MSATAAARLRVVGRTDDGDPDTAVAAALWTVVTEPGDAVAGHLVAALGAVDALRLVTRGDDALRIADACRARVPVADEDHRELVQALVAALARWAPRLRHLDPDRVLDAAAAVGARLLVPGDRDWPERLADLGPHAPLALWVRSTAPPASWWASAPSLAVVGSRAETPYGAETAADLASAAADAGVLVVSGGAHGIDAVAHRVALAAGTPTVAVLAGGVDQLYPAANVELLHRVMRRGAVVAEAPPGVRPTRWRFLQRNRLIAALADAVVVVEAGARSGALNTAHHAAQLGRPVLAVPGPLTSPSSVGCHRLVSSGRATLLTAPADAVRAVSGPDADGGPLRIRSAQDDPELLRVLDALSRRAGLSVDEVARRSGLGTAATEDALALAELEGRAERHRTGWRLVP